MSERMHPEDLRALIMGIHDAAACIIQGSTPNFRRVDVILEEAHKSVMAPSVPARPDRVDSYPTIFAYEAVCKARKKWQARAEAAEARVVAQDGIIDACNKSLDDAEARVRDLTAQVEALNHLDEEAADEAREWKERAERAETAYRVLSPFRRGVTIPKAL